MRERPRDCIRVSGNSSAAPRATSYGEPLLDWLREHRESNFFAYVHVTIPTAYTIPHADFRGWYEELAPGTTPVARDEVFFDPEWVTAPTLEGRRALYDGEIRANDHYFERVLEELRRLELLEDTLVVSSPITVSISASADNGGTTMPDTCRSSTCRCSWSLRSAWSREGACSEPVRSWT